MMQGMERTTDMPRCMEQKYETGRGVWKKVWNMHWRRLVKNIGWANQNIGGKLINAWAFLNYWGVHSLAAPSKVYTYGNMARCLVARSVEYKCERSKVYGTSSVW